MQRLRPSLGSLGRRTVGQSGKRGLSNEAPPPPEPAWLTGQTIVLLLAGAAGWLSLLTHLNSKIVKMDSKIDVLGIKMDGKIDVLGIKMGGKIDVLGTTMDAKFGALGAKIDTLGAKMEAQDLKVAELGGAISILKGDKKALLGAAIGQQQQQQRGPPPPAGDT